MKSRLLSLSALVAVSLPILFAGTVMAAGIPTGGDFDLPTSVDAVSFREELTLAGADQSESDATVILAVQRYIDFFLMFVGAVLLISIVYGGWTYMTALGDADKAKKGSKTIAIAVMGVVIIGLSYAFSRWVLGGLVDVCKPGVHVCEENDDCNWLEDQCTDTGWYCHAPTGTGGPVKYCYGSGT